MCSTAAMKRRPFVGTLGVLALSAGRVLAQRAMPVVGVLVGDSPESFQPLLEDALRQLGYEPGKTIRYDVRSGEGDATRLSAHASELVRARVDVLVARLTPAVLAASGATQTIPIVMAGAGDPIGNRLVDSLARPGRNITGVAGVAGQQSGKLVELARDVLPNIREIAVLANPTDAFTPIYAAEIERAGRALGIDTPVTMIADMAALEATFQQLRNTARRPQSIIVQPTLPRAAAAAFAIAHRLPSFSPVASFAQEGGFIGYGSDQAELFEQVAGYVDRILKGAVPALLPVSQPTRFDLAINMRTANAIGVVVPPTVQARASSLLE